jgi:hypothetical protein
VIGICLLRNLDRNFEVCGRFLKGLLGPEAIAVEKSVSERSLVQIGYQFDLGESLKVARVGVSGPNLAKSLIGFLRAAPGGVTTRPKMERLASWASRYGQICLHIRPFTRNLYCAYAGKGRAQSFTLDEATLRSVRVIRLMLVMTVLEPLKFSRFMRSFRLRRITVIIEFDAFLSGIGIIWYVMDEEGNERPVGGVAVDILLLGFGEDSQFQN